MTKADVENARRANAKLVEHAVPRTIAVLKFVEVLMKQFSDFQSDKMLSSILKPT